MPWKPPSSIFSGSDRTLGWRCFRASPWTSPTDPATGILPRATKQRATRIGWPFSSARVISGDEGAQGGSIQHSHDVLDRREPVQLGREKRGGRLLPRRFRQHLDRAKLGSQEQAGRSRGRLQHLLPPRNHPVDRSCRRCSTQLTVTMHHDCLTSSKPCIHLRFTILPHLHRRRCRL